jgi:phosphatidylglycerol:prolipoprotein diacylglycerol transferase
VNSLLETTLSAVRGIPYPGVWPLLQVCAALVALACVAKRTRYELKFSVYFAVALLAGSASALLLGTLFRAWERHLGHDAEPFGFASYGALLGICVCFAMLAKRANKPWLASLDTIAPALALCVGIGRIGCFFSGCDAGRITTSALGVRFPAGSAAFREQLAQGFVLPSDAWSLRVYPAQLYEALAALALALLVVQLGRRLTLRDGTCFAVMALGYALARTIIDTLRAPSANALYGVISSALVATLVLWILIRERRATSHNVGRAELRNRAAPTMSQR